MAEQIYNPTDTICAISTPPGCGGIAVIRLSGERALDIAANVWKGKDLSKVQSHTVHLGQIMEIDGTVLDQCVATVFRAPASYTGDDTIEFSIHGSRWIQRRVLELLREAGARMALRGEYTRRAYTAGHLDLAQAEGVGDLIAASSRASHTLAMSQMRGGISKKLAELREQLLHLASLLELELDFSDQDVEFVPRSELITLTDNIVGEIKRLHSSFATGKAVREGFPVAIIGAVNAGKSRLLNALLDDERAIVSDIPGTTRDIVEDTCEVGDYLIRFLDTAGIRHTDDPIERIGIDRSHQAAERATLVLYVVDATAPEQLQTIQKLIAPIANKTIIVVNKTDLLADKSLNIIDELNSVVGECLIKAISAATGDGLDELLATISAKLRDEVSDNAADDILITAARHAEALADALKSANEAITALSDPYVPTDLVAHHLRQTIHHLSAITGAITTPQILNNIFTHFCIGK